MLVWCVPVLKNMLNTMAFLIEHVHLVANIRLVCMHRSKGAREIIAPVTTVQQLRRYRCCF